MHLAEPFLDWPMGRGLRRGGGEERERAHEKMKVMHQEKSGKINRKGPPVKRRSKR